MIVYYAVKEARSIFLDHRALSRSITGAEQRLWQARSARVKRLRETLNPDDLTEVLEAIAMLHTERESATAGIATQLAVADTRSHR